MEFITDIMVVVDEADYKDPRKLFTLLQSYSSEKRASGYVVRGSYDELESLSTRLLEARLHSATIAPGQTRQQDKHTSPGVRPVEVSGVVMAYIEEKCATQLGKITGTSFAIETVPEPGDTVRVSFRSNHVSVPPVRADFVRRRFITFYQRTASDLQVTSIRMSPQHDREDLQRRFQRLLFKPGHSRYEATVTGPFVHVAKLKEFLSQKTSSSSKSPGNEGPADAPSGRTSGSPSPRCKDPEEDPCPICMEPITAAVKQTLRCKHSFCRSCLKTAFEYKPVCPTCGELYGVVTGTQPRGGQMKSTQDSSSLPGYENYGTIIITYYIPSGIQQEEHPNPGQPYEGASRRAYLPDSSEGRRILKLLKRAFDQRLIFTVGRSTTSGRNNMVTWNDVHHKTSMHGGPTHYGYPDPHYLSRVRDELKVKGIE